MYKIYNNEIKITNNLKGGSSDTGSAPFPPGIPKDTDFNADNTEPYLYNKTIKYFFSAYN